MTTMHSLGEVLFGIGFVQEPGEGVARSMSKEDGVVLVCDEQKRRWVLPEECLSDNVADRLQEIILEHDIHNINV